MCFDQALWGCSSVAEQWPLKPFVVGSSPTTLTKLFGIKNPMLYFDVDFGLPLSPSLLLCGELVREIFNN